MLCAIVGVGALAGLDFLDREDQKSLQALRRMHAEGLGPDPDSIFDTPSARTRRRAVGLGALLLALIARDEWVARRSKGKRDGNGGSSEAGVRAESDSLVQRE